MLGYDALTDLLKALAHPVRAQIVAILGLGEACVCHLTAVLGQRQPYVSQQLMVLREAGVVTDRREGLMVYYSLADARILALLAVAKDMVHLQHGDLVWPAEPRLPVSGCTCPKCEAATTRADDLA